MLLLRWSFGLFLIVHAVCGFGQKSNDARELLNQVAEASKNLQTYRAEGRIAMQLLMMGPPVLDLTFRVGAAGSKPLPYRTVSRTGVEMDRRPARNDAMRRGLWLDVSVEGEILREARPGKATRRRVRAHNTPGLRTRSRRAPRGSR